MAEPANTVLQLATTGAAHSVPRPLCLLPVLAAEYHVGGLKSNAPGTTTQQEAGRSSEDEDTCRLLGSMSQRDCGRIRWDDDPRAAGIHKASEIGVIERDHRVGPGLLGSDQVDSVKYHPGCERSRSTSHERRPVDSLGRRQKRQHRTQPPYGSLRAEWEGLRTLDAGELRHFALAILGGLPAQRPALHHGLFHGR